MFRPCTFPVNLPVRHSLCLVRHNPHSIRRAGPLYCTFSEKQTISGLSGRTVQNHLGDRLGVSSQSPFSGQWAYHSRNATCKPTESSPVLFFPGVFYGGEELVKSDIVKVAKDRDRCDGGEISTCFKVRNVQTGILRRIFLGMAMTVANFNHSLNYHPVKDNIAPRFFRFFLFHFAKEEAGRYFSFGSSPKHELIFYLCHRSFNLHITNYANFAKSKLGIADGHNKSKQLFIPNGKIGKFQVLGINVASPCYVLSKNGWDLQGRGAFLIPGIPIPSVRDVIASLAFLWVDANGKNQPTTVPSMSRYCHSMCYIIHASCTPLCRRNNVCRPFRVNDGKLYLLFPEKSTLYGLSGRTENDRLGGRLGVSPQSPFYYTGSAKADNDFIIFAGGQKERTLNLIFNPQQVSLNCPLFNGTLAGIGGVNQFACWDGRADQTKDARASEWLGVLPVRPFFTLVVTYHSIIAFGKGNKYPVASAAGWGMPFPIYLSGATRTLRPGTLTSTFFRTGDASIACVCDVTGVSPTRPPMTAQTVLSTGTALPGFPTMYRKTRMGATATGGGRAWNLHRCCHRSAALSGEWAGTKKSSAQSLLFINPKHL